jgi:hypothetical protein
MSNDREFWPFSDSPSDAISIYKGPEFFLQEFAEAEHKSQVAFATRGEHRGRFLVPAHQYLGEFFSGVGGEFHQEKIVDLRCAYRKSTHVERLVT